MKAIVKTRVDRNKQAVCQLNTHVTQRFAKLTKETQHSAESSKQDEGNDFTKTNQPSDTGTAVNSKVEQKILIFGTVLANLYISIKATKDAIENFDTE